MDSKLLQVLACPLCKGELLYNKHNKELHCRLDRLAYPIRDGIPVLIVDEARKVSDSE